MCLLHAECIELTGEGCTAASDCCDSSASCSNNTCTCCVAVASIVDGTNRNGVVEWQQEVPSVTGDTQLLGVTSAQLGVALDETMKMVTRHYC